MRRKWALILFAISLVQFNCQCSRGTSSGGDNGGGSGSSSNGSANFWLTTGNAGIMLEKQSLLSFSATANGNPTIEVDTTTTMQPIEGFGFALTGASAYLINHMGSAEKTALLKEMFGFENNSISVSYLRISIGASDLNTSVYSYDDMPAGQTDVNLDNFSLGQDTIDLIPVLKQILIINPSIKILGSPWSPPVWMKDNGSTIGGSLQTQYYPVYAKYFVRYIQAMQAKGITVEAITVQNEPQHGGNNPSMVMSATQQADFIKNHLGPAFQSAGLSTHIICWDHNCDNPNYPLTVLNDPVARPFVYGTAFHLYSGDVSALSTVHNAYPDKPIYFTEQWTGSNEIFADNLKWHLKNVIIGTMRNWSRVALEWNLANDPTFSMHTPGGCSECKGALTINGSVYTRNPSYYIIAHASKFVPPGSVRIGSNIAGNIQNVAFRTPSGNKVVIALNDGSSTANFNIKFRDQWIATSLPAGGVGTYIW